MNLSSLFFLITFLVPCLANAEPLPLSTSYWKDPSFLKSFNGSYRIEARIEPSVSTEERLLLVSIQQLMADGKRNEALEKLRTSSLTEKSAALTFNLANLYFETGQNELAILGYQAALKEYPSFRRAHKNLAVAYIRVSKMPEALNHLTEAVRLGDAEGSTYGLIGYCRLAREEHASALQAYRMAQVTEPEVAEWKAGIAQCLEQIGNNEEAVSLLNEVVAQRPLEASYACLLANLYLELQRPNQASKALELPFRLGILPADSILILSELHLRAERVPAAQIAFDAAYQLEKKPSQTALLRLIAAGSDLGNWPWVKALLEKTENYDHSRNLRRAKAEYLIASKENPAQGIEELQRLIKEDPSDGASLLSLAKSKAKSGEESLAELLFERATKDHTSQYEAFVELAKIRAQQSRFQAAITAIDSAIGILPSESLQNYRDALAAAESAAE